MRVSFDAAQSALVDIGCFVYRQGGAPATSGNYSMRCADGVIAMTASGRHKGRLCPKDILRVGPDAVAFDAGCVPSAEALLHTTLYDWDERISCVLHTHSVAAMTLSRLFPIEIIFENYELLKALSGIERHDVKIALPVLANTQDMKVLSATLKSSLEQRDPPFGFLLSGHGLYVWGADADEAIRHVECWETLLLCEMNALMLHTQT